jgi:hypothetical protein
MYFLGEKLNHDNKSRLKSAFEVLAVVGPIICLVDCIVIPIALLLLPLIGFHNVFHGIGDQVLAFLVLLLCGPSLIPGFLKSISPITESLQIVFTGVQMA